MPLLELDKFILNKTVIGIICPSCGGDLRIIEHRNRRKWRRFLLVFSIREAFSYQCNGCGHRFRMFRQYG